MTTWSAVPGVVLVVAETATLTVVLVGVKLFPPPEDITWREDSAPTPKYELEFVSSQAHKHLTVELIVLG
jgi:hypothetical protein